MQGLGSSQLAYDHLLNEINQGPFYGKKITKNIHNLFLSLFQSADGYLVELATRYSTELRTNYGDVLQQLEDLRLAEWSDHAPPPPLAPGHNGQQSCSSTASTASIMTSMASNNPSSSDHLRATGGQLPRQSYVNYPRGQDNEPIYVPGSYLVSQKSDNFQ